ncbi:unnamed protein product [Hymenolepis diminuta]|uniref:Uncharacterized protein n=1 Tax=Hymenolepis diminuta TaxID=6216 RepID=A0A564YSH5_HYMDI|nr:unnamed protein product [Hymenolepis diminuta]
MDLYLNLYELGFSGESIDFARKEGHTSVEQVIQFLCGNPRKKGKRILFFNWRNLRTPGFPRIHSPNIDQLVVYRTAKEISLFGNALFRSFGFQAEELRRRLAFGRLCSEPTVIQSEENKGVRQPNMELSPSSSGRTEDHSSVIFIKFHISPYFSPISRPNIGQFNPSISTQQDLENFVQFLILDVRTRHHSIVTLDLPCISLTTIVDSSLRQLNNPATRTSLLADLGITRSTSVLLEHDSETCLNIQQSGSATFCHRRPFPSDADGNNNRHDDFGASPPNSMPPSKRFRRRHLDLFSILLGRGTSRPESQGSSSIALLLTLRELCINVLMRYIQVIGRFHLDFHGINAFSGSYIEGLWVLSKQLSWACLPVQLSSEIIEKLRCNYQLNASTLALLKNFVYDLDLSHNQVSREMIYELAVSWPRLAGLNLANIPDTLGAEQLKILAELKNLHYLNITGQEFVDGDVLKSLAALPKLKSLAITNNEYSECCWEELWHYHCLDGVVVSPLQILAVNGTAFKDSSLLAVVKLFPNLRVLNFQNTEVTGFYHSIDGVASLQELRFVMCSRKLVLFPPFLVPKVTPYEKKCGLIRIDVQRCDQLNIEQFLDQINGQPVQYINGFAQLPSVNCEYIQRLSEMDIPLKELSLSFFASSFPVSKLTKIIKNLSKSLCKLHLPMNSLEAVDNRSVNELVSSILMARHLQEIDFGKQSEILSTRQLIRIVRELSALERIIARDMTDEQETELKNHLPPKCLLRIAKTP